MDNDATDPLAAARGLMTAFSLSLPIWAALVALVRALAAGH